MSNYFCIGLGSAGFRISSHGMHLWFNKRWGVFCIWKAGYRDAGLEGGCPLTNV